MTRRLRIIVADDEPDLRRYYCAMLTLLGHDVVAMLEDGNELLTACNQHQPDLVVTGITMPNLDALGAIGTSHPDQRFIIISAHDKSDAENQFDGQVIARLTKPIGRADIARVMAIASEAFGRL